MTADRAHIFGRTTAAAALVAAALAGPLGCEREDRELRVDPSDAETSVATRTSGLYPGPHAEDPSHLVRTALAPRPLVNQKNERNAHALSEGKRLYAAYNCRGCHANGGGGMGPPLMDDGWAYGGETEQIVETIARGRPGGMPAFGGRIPEFQVRQLAAFVRSLSGNVAGDAAPSREDHMRTRKAENSLEKLPPRLVPPNAPEDAPLKGPTAPSGG